MILTESDGLEVDEEEILLNLGKDEKLIICEPNEKYLFEGTYVFLLRFVVFWLFDTAILITHEATDFFSAGKAT